MRILHICSYYSDRLYTLLVRELERAGSENVVFYFGKHGYDFPNGEPSNVKCVECYSDFDRLLFRRKESKVWPALSEELHRKYDLVHAHSLFSNGYLAYRAKKAHGLPYVVAVRSTDLNVFFRFRLSLRNLGLRILSEASRVIFITPTYKEKLLSEYVPASMRDDIARKSEVIPNGIDDLFFEANPGQIRENPDDVTVLQVGRISRRKNQLTTMRATEVLRESDYLEAMAQTLDGSPIVERIEKIEQQQLIQEYRNASVMCMPSLHETFGLAYIEAMSQGTPVIYSKGEGIDGFFSPGEVGYPVDPKSPVDIADAIRRALEGGEELSNRCIERSRAFRWDKIAGRYVHEVYGEVLGAEL